MFNFIMLCMVIVLPILSAFIVIPLTVSILKLKHKIKRTFPPNEINGIAKYTDYCLNLYIYKILSILRLPNNPTWITIFKMRVYDRSKELLKELKEAVVDGTLVVYEAL